MDASVLNRSWRKPLGRVSRLLNRWRLGSKADEQIAQWQQIVETGERLAALMASPGWATLLTIKQSCQSRADQVMHTHTLSEEVRKQAAVEWATLEGFFRELSKHVSDSVQAKKALSQVTTSQS